MALGWLPGLQRAAAPYSPPDRLPPWLCGFPLAAGVGRYRAFVRTKPARPSGASNCSTSRSCSPHRLSIPAIMHYGLPKIVFVSLQDLGLPPPPARKKWFGYIRRRPCTRSMVSGSMVRSSKRIIGACTLVFYLTSNQAVLKVMATTESGGSWPFAFPSLILTVCKG
jgi:hypothetical protein